MTTPDGFTLTSLLLPAPAINLAQNFLGGVMTMWNPISYTNTVLIGGRLTLSNLPVISPNGLTEGTVLLMKISNNYVIVGMLAEVGSVQLDPIRYRALPLDLTVTSSTALVNAGVLNFLLNSNTQYAVDGCLFYNAGNPENLKLAFDGPPNMAAKWNAWGTQDTTATHLIFTTVTGYGDANTQEVYGWGYSTAAHPRGWFSTTDTGGILQLRFAQNSSGTVSTILQQGSWLRVTELGPSSGATTYITQYQCTASRSYSSSGAFIGSPDGDNNMYQGSFSGRSFGSEESMWVFNGAQIRGDLAGASLDSARVFLYCFLCDGPPGDANYFWTNNTSVPTTFPTSGSGGGDANNVWTPPGWGSFDITSQMGSILAGANSMTFSAGFFTAPTAWRGYGYSASYRPYIQVTYTK